MALSTVPLLSSLFLSLLHLATISNCILDPTSTTLAISQATGTVCGIAAGSRHHRVLCTFVQESNGLNTSVPIYPTLSFNAIMGGHDFICSLRTGDSSFFCWDGINRRVKRVYSGPIMLTELSVGARHVASIEGDPTKIQTIRWRRYGCHGSASASAQGCHNFPKSIDGLFHSLTSGDSFTCAIRETHEVNCWGPGAKSIMMRFAGVHMRSVTAGGSRMCGLNMTGHVICSEDQLNVPSGEAFEFTSIAIGSSHTCAIRRKKGTVVCWDQYGAYSPLNSTSFEFLVAGGDLTCGLTTDDLHVACWGLNWRNLSVITPSLPKILAGVCVPDEVFCSCGVYPDSGTLCGGSGVICKRFDSNTMEACQPTELPRSPSLTRVATWKRLGKWWFVFAISGAAVALAFTGFVLHVNGMKLTGYLLCGRGPFSSEMDNHGFFSFINLQIATNNFSRFARLRVGGYGAVYKGQLSDGHLVAVKHCYDLDSSSFDAELYKLAMIDHENIITLIGFCEENNERLIVFKFMCNKDLYENLHPKFWFMKSPLYSSWKMRVKVLLDAAKGIAHLHQNPYSPMIHRNINSKNILIDENWVAKIADFGFALFGPERGNPHVNAGTPVWNDGYIDPEYDHTGYVTPGSDVYSFGVVMFEILTGRKAFDKGVYLANEVAPVVAAGHVQEVLDRRLAPPVGCQMDAVKLVGELACYCVMESELCRPHMRNVVLQLQSAFGQFD